MEMFANAKSLIPVQMYSCTDRDGTIHPQRFKFQEKDGTIRTYDIIRIIDKKEFPSFSIAFEVVVEDFGIEKIIRLEYHLTEHRWSMPL